MAVLPKLLVFVWVSTIALSVLAFQQVPNQFNFNVCFLLCDVFVVMQGNRFDL